MEGLLGQQRRIPTLLGVGGLIVLLVGLTFATSGLSQVKKLLSFAREEVPAPQLPTGNFGGVTRSTPTPTAASTSGRFIAPTPSAGGAIGGTLQVNLQSGQTVSTSLPTISGKAGARQVVKIQIHSDTTYTGTVVAGPDGSWSWTPPASLTPGVHTATITVVNPDGTTQTVTRTFTVSAGVPILPVTAGTPSAQLTHMACVYNACQSVAGGGANQCTVNADCAAAPTPRLTPAAKPPVTGSTDGVVPVLTFGFIFLTLGVSLFLFTARHNSNG